MSFTEKPNWNLGNFRLVIQKRWRKIRQCHSYLVLTQSKSQGLTLAKRELDHSSLFRQRVNNTGKSFMTLLTGADPAKIVRSKFTHS